jgi:hypothetical protein
MTRVLFAGPSIHGLGIESSGDLLVCGPARCGDILASALDGAAAIGLVDGFFATERSVWHKEILFALSRGVRVLGAASMGALRAAECDRFGMEGVGRIYTEYRDGVRIADSDVALLHGPAEIDYCPLTVALVDADATIAELARLGRLKPDDAQGLLDAAHRLHFTRRTWPTVARMAGLEEAVVARVLKDVEVFKVDRKKQDAVALVERMLASDQLDGSIVLGSWTLNRTHYLAQMFGGMR